MQLEQMGWNARWSARFAELGLAEAVPGRVVRQDGAQCSVATAEAELSAVLPGRWRREGEERLLPAVGDWVALEVLPGLCRIAAVLPRDSALTREAAGARTEAQVVAANLDRVFVVTDGGADFNPRRIERYLVAIQAGAADAAVIVNKADAVADPAPLWRAVERAAPGVPAVLVSAQSGEGLDTLWPLLAPGSTVAFVGSSGVGKSTLINRLLGSGRQATGAVRESDGRGRHTTTRRELLVLPNGTLIVDTPGLREVAAWHDDAGALAAGFADVAALAAQCRFRNCTHRDEPGCAVHAAVADGRIDAGRLANLHQLEREAAFQQSRRDEASARDRKRTERILGKVVRDIDSWHPKRR